MYVIVGATGNTGKVIVETLLAEKKKVRAIGRSAGRLKPLVDKGAVEFLGSVEDSSAMAAAFTGATAVYTMIPPNYAAENLRAYQNQAGEALVAAIAQTGVQYVVNLSSVGANLAAGGGPVNGLHDMEQRLNALSGVHVRHLRPCFFMENFFLNLDLIRTAGINGTPLKPDLRIPMIATRDIASVASQRLLNLDFHGKSTIDLLGERDLSMREATQILGRSIGKDSLPYVQFPYEEAQKAMLQMGLSLSMAEALVEMYRSINEGIMKPTEQRSAANTTPTPFENFALQFAGAYRPQT